MSREKATIVPLMAAAIVVCTHAGEESDELKLSLWDRSINLRGALGYKDNLLLSDLQREGSAFWLSGVDFSLLRAGLDEGPSITLFASAEDRRYFSSNEIEKEQLVLSQAKINQQVSDNWSVGAIAQYLYADQVFDASATEQLLETLPVKSHNVQVGPILTRTFPWNSELELKLTGERQLFNEPLDDYWEMGTQLMFTKKYGNRSSASLSYTYDHRLYDTRNALELNRQPIPETKLRFDQHEFEFTLNHSWDEERHWRSRVRALFEINQDNGVGFYDYYRYRIINRFGYYGKDWQATLEGKILHYNYQKQPVLGTTRVRQVWEYIGAVHVEKIIWRNLKLFADAEFETVHSNYELEEYKVKTVLAGVDWEF
jgi:hypothetical protein